MLIGPRFWIGFHPILRDIEEHCRSKKGLRSKRRGSVYIFQVVVSPIKIAACV